jgi:hypothetical protein
MIKLKSLLIRETRIIEPENSLLVGDITLYHGTSWKVAKKAKKGELGPINTKELIIPILINYFGESSQKAEEIYEKYIYSYRRKEDPNVLFLTTKKDQAIQYAQYTAKWCGEIVYDVLKNYFLNHNVSKETIEKFHSTINNEPAVITLTVPLSTVYTHPYWKTPMKDRIKDAIRRSKRWNMPMDFNMEVFVYEKIPTKYIQRIDKV